MVKGGGKIVMENACEDEGRASRLWGAEAGRSDILASSGFSTDNGLIFLEAHGYFTLVSRENVAL